MELNNAFVVERSRDETWAALLDIEKMALCMPGASLTSLDGDAFTGKVTLRVGPVMMTYHGEGTIAERDEAGRALSLRLSGKEARGAGTALALVRAQLSEQGPDRTAVEVTTELDLTGKPAQFGRGVLAEVAGAIIGKFARNLADLLGESSEPPQVSGGSGGGESDERTTRTERPTGSVGGGAADSLDVGSLALAMARERRSEIVAALATVALLVVLLRRRRAAR